MHRAALLAGAALCVAPGVAFAQTSGSGAGGQGTSTAGPNTGQLEEVVITASKYEQTVQTTPLAVTALNAAALDRRGVTDVQGLSTEAPNVQIGTNGGNASVDISVRGITTNNVNAYSGNPAVAAYIDGVYVPRTEGLDAGLYDVERVEVLRGPQGTLYGRNATAGAVNIITARPVSTFAARGDLAYGNYGAVTAHAMVNTPVAPTLSVRAVGFLNRNNGYQSTLGTTREHYYKADQAGARLSALWKPTSRVSWLIEADAFRDQGVPNLGIATPVPGTIYPVPNGFSAYRRPVTPGENGAMDVRVQGVRTNLDIDLGSGFALAYIGGAQQVKLFTFTDGDGLPQPITNASYSDSEWNTGHEVDLRYASDRLKAVVGANYTYEKDVGDLVVNFPPNPPTAQQLQFPHPKFQQLNYGVFGQVTYSVTDALRVTGGLRYSADHASNLGSGTLFCPLNSPAFIPFSQCRRFSPNSQASQSWDDVSWKVGVDYDLTPRNLLYGSVSTGFKQGALSNAGQPIVNPETVTNYEVGMKNRLFDGRVTLNGSLFYMDYSNLQVSQVIFVSAGVTQNVTTNAAKASNYGAEFEGAWLITPNDQVSGFVSYLHATYDKFLNAIDAIVDPNNRNPLDLSGNDLIRSPRFSVRLSYNHTFDFENGGRLTPEVSVFYQTKSYLREFNRAWDLQPSYTRSDARLTYEFPGRHWSAEAYVLNIENKAVRVAEYASSTVLNSYYAPPRRWGAKLSFRY